MAKANGPDKQSEIENLIRSILGVEPKFVADYDRLQIRVDERVQSRIDRNTAPTSMVDRYANQMGEYTFPPIIVTKDHIVIDGNTRAKARAKRNERYIDALVVPVSWDTADPDTRRKLLYVSELINNMNGLPLDDTERRKMVVTMIEQDSPDEEIVTKVGMSQKDISDIRSAHRGKTRLVQVGIDPDKSKIQDRALRAFGTTKVMKLDDELFRDIASLAVDAGLKANEIKGLAATVGDAGSMDMRRERIERERQAREEQIASRKQGVNGASLARQLRSRLGFLMEHPLAAFIEHNSELVDEHLELIERVRDRLEEIQHAHGPRPIMPPPLGKEVPAPLA